MLESRFTVEKEGDQWNVVSFNPKFGFRRVVCRCEDRDDAKLISELLLMAALLE